MLRDCTTFVFDLDGTLVTTNLDFVAMKASVVRLATEHGVSADDLESLDILGAVDLVCARLNGDAPAFRARAEEALAAWEVEGARRNAAMEGAVEVLAALRRRGFKVGIVTRNSRAAAAETLRRVPLPHDLLLTRHDVAHAKPHPEHLRRMLDALEADPARSVMVGDHWMDVQAGRRAGMRTVGVLGPHGPERFATMPPDILLPSIRSLADCLAPED